MENQTLPADDVDDLTRFCSVCLSDSVPFEGFRLNPLTISILAEILIKMLTECKQKRTFEEIHEFMSDSSFTHKTLFSVAFRRHGGNSLFKTFKGKLIPAIFREYKDNGEFLKTSFADVYRKCV